MSDKLKLLALDVLQQQSVNRHLFEQILVEKFSSKSQASKLAEKRVDLSCQVCMKLLKRYEKLDTKRAAVYTECLSNMAMVSSEQEPTFYQYTLEWIANIDRGGLFYISDTTFCFFKSVGVKTQEFPPQHLRSQSTDTRKELLMKVIKDDDVQFWWSMVAYDIDDVTENTDLLHIIVDLWITIRGFAITSTWIEQYKLAQKTSVKKSKLKETIARWTEIAVHDINIMIHYITVTVDV